MRDCDPSARMRGGDRHAGTHLTGEGLDDPHAQAGLRRFRIHRKADPIIVHPQGPTLVVRAIPHDDIARARTAGKGVLQRVDHQLSDDKSEAD